MKGSVISRKGTIVNFWNHNSRKKVRVSHDFKVQSNPDWSSVSGTFLYLLYTTEISTSRITVLGTFADDTVIVPKGAAKLKAIENHQVAAN